MPSYDLGPAPHLGYTDSVIDRAAQLRTDPGKIAALAAGQRAGAYVIGGEMIVLKRAGDQQNALFTMAEAMSLAPVVETAFLGLKGDSGRFAVGIAPDAAEQLKTREDLLITDLRTVAVQGLAAAEDLPPIAEAKALLHWHASHRFCANCGHATRPSQAGWKRECPNCKREHFPRTDPVAIMLAIKDGKCLLGRSPRFVPTMWSCLAGFVEPGESFEDAVRRETLEEAGIQCGRVTYISSQPWPFPTSLMVGCFAEALTTEIVVDRSELEDARWFTREDCAAMLLRNHPEGLTCPPPVAIAHHIIRGWVERGDAVLG